MKRYLITTLLISTCVVATQAMAYGFNNVVNAVNKATDMTKAVQETQTHFTDAERNTYKEYFNKESKNKQHDKDVDNDNNKNKSKNNNGHDKKYSSLPPGLQKKAANGGSLPPGWQKKAATGQVFDSELRSHSTHSPYTSPKGTSTYLLENKAIRVIDSTNVILDVLTN